MTIPTEPIGSIPRPTALIDAISAHGGEADRPELQPLFDAAVADTIARFEAVGSPVVSDGEQRKYPSFFDYPLRGSPNLAPDGFEIPFTADHARRIPRLLGGPFRYRERADRYLEIAQRYAQRPVKQAVISPSALSLIYPSEALRDYPREEFIEDLLGEHVAEVCSCLQKGCHVVQIDFIEGRLAVKLDPSGMLLAGFVELNNLALSRFSNEERKRIGVHTCPGSDRASIPNVDIDYSELLPSLLQLRVTNFYIALASNRDSRRALRIVQRHLKTDQRVFVGVIDPTDPHIETPEQVCERVREAADYIPIGQLGTTDDCGFSPFSDDTSTTRDAAFAKISARILGTRLASRALGVD